MMMTNTAATMVETIMKTATCLKEQATGLEIHGTTSPTGMIATGTTTGIIPVLGVETTVGTIGTRTTEAAGAAIILTAVTATTDRTSIVSGMTIHMRGGMRTTMPGTGCARKNLPGKKIKGLASFRRGIFFHAKKNIT